MDKEFVEKLVGKALDTGADEAEVYLRTVRRLGIEVRDRKVDTLESSVTRGYCVRVIRDKRVGFSYSTDPGEADSVAERAVEASKYTEPDEFAGLPSSFSPPPGPGGIYDDAIASLSEEEAIQRVLLIESSAREEDTRITRIRKASGGFSVSSISIANSHGIFFNYASTGCSASLSAVAEDRNESQIGWDYSGSRLLREVSFEQTGRNAAQKALQLLGARKIAPLKGFVLLDNAIATEFLEIFSAALSSEMVQKKKSMLAGKRGEQVVSPRINLVDNGLLTGKLGSKPVDDEGVPVTTKTLIEKGVLQGFLYNTYTARKEGCRSTGNALRGGFTGLPSVGPTNLYLESAAEEYKTGLAGLLERIDRGFYVLETMGMHTANPISGEFSVGASGLWIEGGEIRYPVKEAAISGNILSLFNNIVMVGDDLRFYGNIGSSSLLIEGIDISG
ncbi:MAG: TldD/PmbA family protein [Alphaproteobacteria bacterium]|uniref:TldD/PmbA family protein n=1 Tax=Candidatus Nitrobium versatile TaxID=2884831 RepID=A0A953LWA8_9BACT|nr:TldD/PmbA family protein [Candidatus Nitrobium versatile]